MFILASGSPRRKELLEQLGCDFRIHVSDAEEITGDMPPGSLVVQNAQKKAMAVAKELGEIPVLGADTVVALNGRIYGKPADAEDAKQMLLSLSGRVHHVLTGIVFVKDGKVFSEAVETEVCFGEMTEREIEAYIATGEPMDKAGAYAVQGRAAAFIKEIRGSYSNVVGLPLYAVCRLAERAGVELYGNHGEGPSA